MWRGPDLAVIGLNLAVMVWIGVYCARKSKSSDAYFLAGRNMAGWVVGMSMMATIVSSMTFLATPGFTYSENWRYMPANFTYLLAAIPGLLLFMPLFRRGGFRSAYEYLERRFGTWARLYGGGAFILFQMFRLGVILYAVCLPIKAMTGFSLPWVIVIFGVLVATYTIAGGLEAVIWTDLIQGFALILGGLICLPIIFGMVPGGFGQVMGVALADGKLSVGSTALNFSEKTVWVTALMHLFHFTQYMCVNQMTIQRYQAMKSTQDARKGIVLSAVTTVAVWVFFSFIGTALYVLYKYNPAPEVGTMLPEEVYPFFILSHVPAGVAGFVISGLLAAAMSTLDSSINASAATVTTDFYRRLLAPDRLERHYVTFGRWVSGFFGVVMIGIALIIHYTRTETLQDLQATLISIMSGGLLGLFLLGQLTRRVDGRSAFQATMVTLAGVCLWLFIDSRLGSELFPTLAALLPDKFWIIVLGNTFLFVLGVLLSYGSRRKPDRDLTDLTVWTRKTGEAQA